MIKTMNGSALEKRRPRWLPTSAGPLTHSFSSSSNKRWIAVGSAYRAKAFRSAWVARYGAL